MKLRYSILLVDLKVFPYEQSDQFELIQTQLFSLANELKKKNKKIYIREIKLEIYKSNSRTFQWRTLK